MHTNFTGGAAESSRADACPGVAVASVVADDAMATGADFAGSCEEREEALDKEKPKGPQNQRP